MKKFKIRALAVFSAVLIAAVSIPIASGGTFSVSAAGAELIPGGDMENTVFASNSEAQSGWRYNNGTSVSLSTEQKNSGNSSALLTTEASGYGALSYKPIKVEKNRDYVLSFAFFTETAAEKTPQWSLMSGTKYLSGAKNVKINGDAGKWQSVTALVNSGSYTELTLNIQIGSGGKYYVDDVSFKSEGDPYNLLKNGSFEKGLNSWNLSSDTAFGVSDISPIDGSSLSVAAGAGNTAESTFDCDKNSDYIFSFCSAAADNGTGDVRLEVTDMNGSVLAAGTAGESSEWLISRFAISSGNNDRLKVRIVSGNTAVLIDDIRIMRKAKINILPVEYGEIKGFSEIGYGEGETVSLTAEAEDGYIVSMWKSGDEKIASGESCTFTAFDMTLSVIIGKALVEIPNPGFEEDDLSAYNISFADGFTRSVDNPANGSYSLKISAGDTETRYKNATLTINVVPGLTYTVTFNGRRAESDKTAIFKVLDGENLKDTVLKMIDETIEEYSKIYLADEAVHDNWDLNGMREYFLGWVTTPEDLHFTPEELGNTTREEVAENLKEKAHARYEQREEEFGSDIMREIERVMLLRCVDTNWMDHIDAMDQLRQGIGLRAYGQHDPVVEYRNDSYDMFEAMTNAIREQTAKLVLTVRVRRNEEVKREKVAEETNAGDKPLTVRGKGVVSKNALCPCGSGKKYKRCCGKGLDD